MINEDSYNKTNEMH